MNAYFEEMKKIQEKILDYLESEELTINLYEIFDDNKIHDNRDKIVSIFYLILKISSNYHHNEMFFRKIESIFLFFKEDMQTKFSNSQLFHIFKSNKKILLFLLEESLLKFDEQIVKKIIKPKYLEAKYPQFFSPEIQPFMNENWFPKYTKNEEEEVDDEYRYEFEVEVDENKWVGELKKDLPEDFYEKRKIGENDDFLCKLIQKDSIDDFIMSINKNIYSLKSKIKVSIYETNNFLLKYDKIELIEYAAFFGSIQIFNFLRFNGVKLTPSLWLYAIHGKNAYIIHLLEENQIKPKNDSYKDCLKEAIKCHHNDIAIYIQDNYLLNEEGNSNDIIMDSLKYYNFYFHQSGIIDEMIFCCLCEYDYYKLAKSVLLHEDIDINYNQVF